MTIKELEARTGMTRANIRYYESEGLIAPKRLDNGYRDYSEEDVNTLEKIHLLRELRLDIDAIRLVQKGSLTLEQALFNLLNRLEGEKAVLDQAAEVCRQLERSGVEYGELDPKPWLDQLAQPQRPQLTAAPKPVEQYDVRPDREWVEYASFHPFMRWMARGLDTAIHSLLVYAVLMLGFHWNGNGTAIVEWFVSLLCVGVTLLCEPFWLHFWGWTPGKRIFGLKLRNYRGEKLTIGEGFERSLRLFGYELLFLIPLVNLVLLGFCIKRLYDESDFPWDDLSSHQYIREEQRLTAVKYIAAWAAAVGLMMLVLMSARLVPPHRGSLTAEDYYDNVNHYMNMLTNSGDRLSEDGEWILAGNVSFGELPSVQLELENGTVTAVTLTEISHDNWVYQRADSYQICLLAFAAAEGKDWPRSYNRYTVLFDGRWDSFEADEGGIHVSQVVERSGYEGIGQILSAVSGQTQSYSRTVTISLIGDESG